MTWFLNEFGFKAWLWFFSKDNWESRSQTILERPLKKSPKSLVFKVLAYVSSRQVSCFSEMCAKSAIKPNSIYFWAGYAVSLSAPSINGSLINWISDATSQWSETPPVTLVRLESLFGISYSALHSDSLTRYTSSPSPTCCIMRLIDKEVL